jgi:hypothetical protein
MSVSPFNLRYFYEESGWTEKGNFGSACVTIRRADLLKPRVNPASPVCLEAAERARTMLGE